MWRVLTGLQKEITISFMMVGHTKFAPDCCFGVLKRRFRRERVNCLDELATVVESSSASNTAQLVGKEDGTTYIDMYDWMPFLAPHLKRIPGMKQYHHFTITSDIPGVLQLKMFADSQAINFTLLRGNWAPSPDDLPATIPPPGLSLERQQYLYHSIRPYCSEETQDIVCPVPVETATSTPSSPESSPEPESFPSPEPPVKRPRQRRCRVCGEAGHNARTCTHTQS